MGLGRVARSVAGPFAGFDYPVYIVSIGQFVIVFGGGVVYPVQALYFVETIGPPFSLVGAGLLTNSVARAAGMAVGGYGDDRTGRVPVKVVSMALSVAAIAAGVLALERRVTTAENAAGTR